MTKLLASEAQLKGVSTQMTCGVATASVAKAVGSSTEAMKAINAGTCV